ncbi:FAD-dependent oxidoreductase [Aurantimonas sp. A2-1-M11]|uniref:FAD-dependent oxidoreductase n=1 Tax=Aurantimonas sp. A2-1-M11 TaxID=3113712 RepID=UPI002F931B35
MSVPDNATDEPPINDEPVIDDQPDDELPALPEGQPVDVVILGAGLHGAGLFRDLCAQGVSCLIVDKGDFGSGASAASSRLVEGGLAELEIGDLQGADLAAAERNRLLKIAPHCVETLPVVFPVFSRMGGLWALLRTLAGSPTVPRHRGSILARIGLALHDRTGARHGGIPPHVLLGRQRALADPLGLPAGVAAAGIYHDARITAPERFVYELVRDGLDACPEAEAASWTSLVACIGGQLAFERDDGSQFVVRPTLVVNAAGAWIDEVNTALGAPSELAVVRKRTHVLLDQEDLRRRLDGRILRFEAPDAGPGRGWLCTAQDYFGRVLVGATDAPTDDPDDSRCDDADVETLLGSLRALLPDLQFGADQIVHATAGIYALPASDDATGGKPGRGSSMPVVEPDADRAFPILSLVGGRWTTYRAFAERATDRILRRLKRSRLTSTDHLAVGGGRNYPGNPLARSVWLAEGSVATWLDEPRLEALLERYGTTALAIAHHRCDYSDGERLPDARSTSLKEIDWIARNEDVVRLEDIVLRRTNLAVTGMLTARDIEAIAIVAAAALRWSPERRSTEIAAVTKTLTETRRMRL